MQPSGRVAFLPPGARVDEEFFQLATRPTSTVRFRYGSGCRESGCAHWQGQRCAALDEVRAHLAPFAQTSASSCSIRPQCRWHQQAGDAACAVCPLVTGELMALEDSVGAGLAPAREGTSPSPTSLPASPRSP